ncbi:MAG: LirA/MavJ family T4SS effector [Solirubrobacteraceae bacterium]
MPEPHPAPAAIRRLQTSAGNRAAGTALRRRTLQRQPTIDLATLYAGKGDRSVVADFVRLQALLSSRAASLPHLQTLSVALDARLRHAPLPPGPPAARAEAATAVLDEVLASYELRCGFSPERPILVGFASADDFKALTAAGQQFHDVGAGAVHGEFTHRIQWFIAMSEITGGTFGARQDPYVHTPRELYAASMSEAYAVDATGPTGKAYMWDWVFDRIAGLRPTGAYKGDDYDPARDAWTHPGESGQGGALSNDIISGDVPGLDALAELRKAQIAGHVAGKATMTTWFDVAAHLGLAKGRAFGTGERSYFEKSLIPGPAAMKELRRIKDMTRGLIDRAENWASMAAISFSPVVTDASIPALEKLRDDVVYWGRSLRDSIGSATGTSPLANAMVDVWFAALSAAIANAVWQTRQITTERGTDKVALGPILLALNGDLAALRAQPGWRVVG